MDFRIKAKLALSKTGLFVGIKIMVPGAGIEMHHNRLIHNHYSSYRYVSSTINSTTFEFLDNQYNPLL